MPKIERALISVSDKAGLIPFAEVLDRAGVEILSTGGTARALREAGIQACLLYTSPSPRDKRQSRMPSSA